MAKKLTKLDTALDVIASVLDDPLPGVVNKSGEEVPPRNRQAWAQRDFIQSLAWKANAALDRQNGPDQRVADIRKRAAEMANKPANEIDMNEATKLAADAEFWTFQQAALEELMRAASECLVRHGHEAYKRQDLTKRSGISADNRQMDQAKVASVLSGLGVTLPEREA